MRLVVATQVIDADHPALGQTIDIVDALARRCDEVVVVCDHVGRADLPDNVRIRTFGSSSRVARGVGFERALVSEALGRGHRVDAVLAHMIPLFVTLAAPICKARRIPLGLWYTHWNADRSLRIGTRLADVVFSVDRRSFPFESPKVIGTACWVRVRPAITEVRCSSANAASFRAWSIRSKASLTVASRAHSISAESSTS